jgi:hypothetical protein
LQLNHEVLLLQFYNYFFHSPELAESSNARHISSRCKENSRSSYKRSKALEMDKQQQRAHFGNVEKDWK